MLFFTTAEGTEVFSHHRHRRHTRHRKVGARARERERERRSHANERKEKQTNRTHFQLFQQFPDQIVRSRRALHRNLYRSQFAIVRRRRFVFRDFIRAADKPRDGARGRRHRPGDRPASNLPVSCHTKVLVDATSFYSRIIHTHLSDYLWFFFSNFLSSFAFCKSDDK